MILFLEDYVLSTFPSLLFSLIVIAGLNSTILTIEYQSLATQLHMLVPSETRLDSPIKRVKPSILPFGFLLLSLKLSSLHLLGESASLEIMSGRRSHQNSC